MKVETWNILQRLLHHRGIDAEQRDGELIVFAKIDKSNVAVARLFFKLSMDPMVGNDCPISIFSGLGGHGLIFFDFGQ